jgi:hypothetical protein
MERKTRCAVGTRDEKKARKEQFCVTQRKMLVVYANVLYLSKVKIYSRRLSCDHMVQKNVSVVSPGTSPAP